MNTSGSIFYNADYVVIEYIDIVKSPYLILLAVLREQEKYKELFKYEDISHLDDMGLCEWYMNRRHRNPLADLYRDPNNIPHNELDKILDDIITSNDIFYKYSNLLNISQFLSTSLSNKISHDIIIYDQHNSNFAKEDLKRNFNKDFTVLHSFDEVLDKAKENSTYILSDINKIYHMKDKGYLKFSSVTIPVEYRYNKKNLKDFNIDFDELWKTDSFKLSYFRACSYEKPEE